MGTIPVHESFRGKVWSTVIVGISHIAMKLACHTHESSGKVIVSGTAEIGVQGVE
jgi:hypothetical protein